MYQYKKKKKMEWYTSISYYTKQKIKKKHARK